MNLEWMRSLFSARVTFALVLTLLMSQCTSSAGAYSQRGYSDIPLSEVTLTTLPPEARATLRLIKQGGPFPYPRDGVVFGNFEKRLPQKQRGYYHEYTVKTPGARNRGARRIICGKPSECYYTGDHYQTFKLIRE
jgi:ribonuclease T1